MMKRLLKIENFLTFYKKYKALLLINGVLIILVVSLFRIYFEIRVNDNKGIMTVSFLDVGQGDALLIQTPSRNNIIIDTGPDKSALFEIENILNYFDQKIDLIISTHAHADHVAGLPHIANKYNILYHGSNFGDDNSSQVMNLYQTLNEQKINQIGLSAGDRIIIDPKHNIYIDILWPSDQIIINDKNDSSVVTLLVYNDVNFLMTGDAGSRIENYLIDEFGDKLISKVLKLGHHGSKTSSAPLFLNTVTPKYVVISAGEDNKYGHPHQEVLDNLESYLSDKKKTNQKLDWPIDWIQSTITNGTIVFKTDGEKTWLVN